MSEWLDYQDFIKIITPMSTFQVSNLEETVTVFLPYFAFGIDGMKVCKIEDFSIPQESLIYFNIPPNSGFKFKIIKIEEQAHYSMR